MFTSIIGQQFKREASMLFDLSKMFDLVDDAGLSFFNLFAP
jgi:hypothetical protein